jgi:hypothetical protein
VQKVEGDERGHEPAALGRARKSLRPSFWQTTASPSIIASLALRPRTAIP